MEQIFATAIQRVSNATNNNGGTLLTGADAINILNQQPPKTFQKVLREGDIVTIPDFSDVYKWLAGPVTHGGPEVTRPLAKVDRNGYTYVSEMFLSQFFNEFEDCDGNIHTNVVYDRHQQVVNFDLACSRYEQWELLVGKRWRLVSITSCPTFALRNDDMIRRDRACYVWQEV